MIAQIAAVAGYCVTILGFLALFLKVWHKLKDIAIGQQCLLRSRITSTYYSHPDNTLREYQRKNLDDLYAAYKALGGNHYVDDIYNEMREWKIDR